ncbi:arginine--tRNA ligase, partial [Streptomyces sp. GC420]|uniref:arginine--tRNA ligase n=1 Tax=Streptomyces sp. GC420 TaxID=2697568 RepID=UPI0014151678
MTPAELSRTVLRAVRSAVDEGALRTAAVPERVIVERPRPGGRGDYASNIALKVGAASGIPPRDVAELLAARIAGAPGITGVEITGPGFLNFTLAALSTSELVARVLREGDRYGYGDALEGVVLSFPSEGDLRTRVVTDCVVRLLRTQGALARTSVGPDGHQGHDDGRQERLRVVALPARDRDVFTRLGTDAARWGMLRTAPNERPRLSAELLVQSETNPLFRVRYAHSRARALLRNAAQLGFRAGCDGHANGDHMQDVAHRCDEPAPAEHAEHAEHAHAE